MSRADSLASGSVSSSRRTTRQDSVSINSGASVASSRKTSRVDSVSINSGDNGLNSDDFSEVKRRLVGASRRASREGAADFPGSKRGSQLSDDLPSGSINPAWADMEEDRMEVNLMQRMEVLAEEQRKEDEEEAAHEDKESAMSINVFNKLKDGGEVHKDDLPKALEFCGYMKPRDDWVHQVFAGISSYTGLEQDEFVEFVQGYKDCQHQAYAEAFNEEDVNATGLIEVSQLERLMLGLDVQPMKHVLDEVIQEVEDGNGLIDLNEFEQVAHIIFVREGFTKKEYEEFVQIYERFDAEKTGEIETKEMASVLNWLGFAWGAQRTLKILHEVDVDKSGTINQREYLMCLRLVREAELKAVESSRPEFAKGGAQVVTEDKVPDILRSLGYDPWDRRVIQEAKNTAGLEQLKLYSLQDLWRLMTVYRKTEGFCVVDIKEMDQAFQKTVSQSRDQGGLRVIGASKALRELGFDVSFELCESILCKVDVDDTGDLDVSEFRKMVRMLQERETSSYREAFDAAVTAPKEAKEAEAKSGAAPAEMVKEITVTRASEAMTSLGFLVNPQYLPQKEPDAAEPMLSVDGFVGICGLHARDVRKVYRRNGGWSDLEVKYFKDIFVRYLPTRENRPAEEGGLTSKELVKLVEDLFPQLAKDRSLRPQLSEMMKQVTVDAFGSLVFKEFLKLMKLFREWEDNEKVLKEWQAVKGTGFNQIEVQEFRDLFIHGGDAEGEISFEKFRAMIHAITPLGDTLTAELEVIFFEMVSKRKVAAHVNDRADFPEFLWLMKNLLDTNFAQLKDKTGAGKEEHED